MTTIANIDINLRARTDELDSGLTRASQKSRKFQTELEQVSSSMQLFAPIGSRATDVILDFANSVPGLGQAVGLFRELYASAQAMSVLDATRAAASASKAAIAAKEAQQVNAIAKAAAESSHSQVIFATAATEAAVSAEVVATAAASTATSLIIASKAMSVLRDQAAGGTLLPSPNMARPRLALPPPRPDFVDADFTFTPHATKAASEIGQVANAANAAKLASAGMSTGMIVGLGAVAAAAGVVVGGFMAVSHAVAQVNEQRQVIDQMSDRAKSLGMTFGELNTLDLSLSRTSGLDSGAIEASMQKLQLNLAEAAAGDGKAREVFERMGLDAADLISEGPLEAMKQISEATQGMESAEQLRVAVELFGKNGAMLVNSLREGPEALEQASQFAKKFGLELSQAQAEQVGAANDAWEDIQLIATGAWRQIAAEVSPVLQVVSEGVFGIADGFAWWHKGLPAVVDNATYFAGSLYDAYEVLTLQYAILQKIVTLDFSGVGDAFNDAMSFDTGEQWVAKINEAREAAKTAADSAKLDRKTADGVEAELNAAREAERIASEGRKAEEDLLKEKERVSKAEAESRDNKIKSLKEEIALLDRENTAGLLGIDFDAQEARELLEAAGQPPEFIEELKRLQDDRKDAIQLRDDLKAAADIRESLKTPFDKMQEQFAQIAALNDKGRLSDRDAMAAGIQLARDNVSVGAAGASTLVQGTAEAYRKTLELEAQGNHEKKVEKFAEEQLKVQKDMLRELQNGKGPRVSQLP